MSLVDRQASVIKMLKLVDTAPRRISRSSSLVASASVVSTASIVAMLGLSIAAPLAMPPTTAPLAADRGHRLLAGGVGGADGLRRRRSPVGGPGRGEGGHARR